MVSPCDNCVHKLVCHYRPMMEQLSDKLKKIFSETNADPEQNPDIFTCVLKCKYYIEPKIHTR